MFIILCRFYDISKKFNISDKKKKIKTLLNLRKTIFRNNYTKNFRTKPLMCLQYIEKKSRIISSKIISY